MQVLDASAVIYAWDNYPPEQLPGIWDWLAEEIRQTRLVIPDVALDEVGHKIPECRAWLRAQQIHILPTSEAVLLEALRLKTLIGVDGERYNPKGVDENDLIIVASARLFGSELISNEARQAGQQVPAKCKIPAVCAMAQVDVRCLNFLEYLKRSGRVFR
ncbi:DUF4411 family protein [Sphaerotilus microaerophilus]|uniref:DNA-binding protein n=1 Tax=Sphaerotilus microaerophilus TaxID=2914710 RepID=A0ABN6PIP3_9BURK|nr:DUF4411 family protein [Sphaerotilus sp. FB-5]BDI03312.1 hypothetical protein CATMQ487_02820 [Sphaerotilus sp. FB-5]